MTMLLYKHTIKYKNTHLGHILPLSINILVECLQLSRLFDLLNHKNGQALNIENTKMVILHGYKLWYLT